MEGRPSAWYAGLGLGMAAAGALLVPVAIGKWPVDWLPVPFIVGLACVGAVPFWEWVTWKEPALAAPKPERITAQPAAAPITVIRRVGGTHMGRPHEIDIEETRPTTWGAWQVAALTWLDWHTRRRSLTRDALTGPGLAFGKPADWVEFTDELARVGLASKENGKPTVLALPLPVVRDRITRGVVEWRTDVQPPAIAHPYPASGVVVEAEKV